MISQSFQDEYADEASAERKALEQKDESAKPQPLPQAPKKIKKQNEGDLGGTNGTLTASEAQPAEVHEAPSQNSRSSSLCSGNNYNEN